MSIDQIRRVELPKIHDPRGNLTFVEADRHVPFKIKRVFYIYDVPGGSERDGRSLKTCHEFFVAIMGSFDVVLHDGRDKRAFHLNRSYHGLHVPPMMWRELDNFSSGAVCLVMASAPYDESDYFRNYWEYLEALAQQNIGSKA